MKIIVSPLYFNLFFYKIAKQISLFLSQFDVLVTHVPLLDYYEIHVTLPPKLLVIINKRIRSFYCLPFGSTKYL
jgi:hypothetical protein